MRNWRPFIADAIREIEATGARRIVGIPLAPQFSTLSVQKYMDAAKAALPAGTDFTCVRSFHDHPLLIEAFAEKVRAEKPQPGEDVVFTAHSIPQRVAASGDPYRERIRRHSEGGCRAMRCVVVPHRVSERGQNARALAGSGLVGLHSRTRESRRAKGAGRARRVRLRPYRDPVRHRRPGSRGGA